MIYRERKVGRQGEKERERSSVIPRETLRERGEEEKPRERERHPWKQKDRERLSERQEREIQR